MRNFLIHSLTIILLSMPLAANAGVTIGEPAPNIVATDTNGNEFNLSDHKGSIVVLEWTNHSCPFVVKHYDSNNMQSVQKSAQEDGVKWVSIVSSAPGRQGHVSAEEANTITQNNGTSFSAPVSTNWFL